MFARKGWSGIRLDSNIGWSDRCPYDLGEFENNVSMCMSAIDDVFAGLFRMRSEALDCEGRVRTLCANGAIPPVSGRISV